MKTKAEIIREAREKLGGFSTPSKMPGFGYGLPAFECKVGSILAKLRNTPCSDCYARKGRYIFPNVQKAQYRRLAILTNNPTQWARDMVEYIPLVSGRERYFRWHDSGDIMSDIHLSAIVWIAECLPEFRFWLPTKEYATVARFLRSGREFPPNLAVRVSAPRLEDTTYQSVTGLVSYIAKGYDCPAPAQDNACGDCRKCWDTSVRAVTYKKH